MYFHYKDKMVSQPSYLSDGNPYVGRRSLYWNKAFSYLRLRNSQSKNTRVCTAKAIDNIWRERTTQLRKKWWRVHIYLIRVSGLVPETHFPPQGLVFTYLSIRYGALLQRNVGRIYCQRKALQLWYSILANRLHCILYPTTRSSFAGTY